MQRTYRGQRKFSISEIREALHSNFGNCYMAARALNETERERGGTRTIDRRAIAYHVKKRPELMTLADGGREEICDVAEQTIFLAIRDGNASLAMRYLEVQGKNRGYSRQVDLVEELSKLDFAKLTTEQLVKIFDPLKFTIAQAVALFDMNRLVQLMSVEQLEAMLVNQGVDLDEVKAKALGQRQMALGESVT
jgi:hypothetical protein